MTSTTAPARRRAPARAGRILPQAAACAAARRQRARARSRGRGKGVAADNKTRRRVLRCLTECCAVQVCQWATPAPSHDRVRVRVRVPPAGGRTATRTHSAPRVTVCGGSTVAAIATAAVTDGVTIVDS